MDPEKPTHVIIPPKEAHLHTIIWIHGLNQSPEKHMQYFNSELFNTFKIILPRAPMAFVTVKNGQCLSWYDIKYRSATSFTDPFDQAFSSQQIHANFANILKPIIHKARKQLDELGKGGKLIIGGFSQGCSMTLHCFYEEPQVIDAMLGISGYLFPISKFNPEDKRKSRVLYGKVDLLRPWEYVKVLYEGKFTEENGKLLMIPETGHEVNERMQQKMRDFIRDVIAKP